MSRLRPSIESPSRLERRAARRDDLRLFLLAWAAGFLIFLVLLR